MAVLVSEKLTWVQYLLLHTSDGVVLVAASSVHCRAVADGLSLDVLRTQGCALVVIN